MPENSTVNQFLYWTTEQKGPWKLIPDTPAAREQALRKGAMFFTNCTVSKPWENSGAPEPNRCGDFVLDTDDAENPSQAWISNGDKIFEELLARLFLHNPHRTTVLLEPDHKMARRIAKEESDRLAEAKQAMTPEQVEAVMADAEELSRLQAAPDSVEDLNSIPRLAVADLPAENRVIPTELRAVGGCDLLFHDLPTNGIAYLDLGFDLSVIPDDLLPYMGVFGRALVESGTAQRDYVDLSQLIACTSGGIWAKPFAAPVLNSR